ncbi:MAG: ABC transporter permease [Candidatus Rokubacteria bacterium RIFCSPLOWO2_12_FULL_71_19]|nr:MAG: ABC transporter permease [Candidatus Rokubacteria bacterium RIFCSPLOWO2_12_FULL_71_19]
MLGAGLLGLGLLWPGAVQAQGPIKIGLVQGITGPFEVYAKQVITGFKLGLEHATGGKLELLGRKIELLIEDDQLKPDVAKQKVTKLYADDKVDLVVGTTSSAAALAVLPVAAEFKKVLIVEPAVADSITGEHWNRYVFRTGRNSGQDAIANALAVARPGVSIATIAQDYAFGKDGVAAYKAAVEKLGAKVVHEEYAPIQATDFTASIQKIIGALKDKPGAKYVFVIWAGKGGPFPQLVANRLDKYGITLTSGSNVLDVLKALKTMGLEGMVGGAYYYYELPKNPMNDWLVKEHEARFKQPPDFFTCGGFAAAMAAVTAIQKAGGTDTEKLIAAMEGMEFNTPKGKMIFRKEDHQALQSMYAFKFVAKPEVPWLVPTLLKELSPQETAPPILNKR